MPRTECVNCDTGFMTRKETDVPVTVRGKEYLIPIEALVCENCGFVELEPDEIAEIMRCARATTYSAQ